MIRNISILVLIFALSVNIYAQDNDSNEDLNPIVTTVPFLTIAPDSRASGMGDAGVASSPDLNSQHWNPSKYPFLEDNFGFAISYTPWLRNLGVNDLNLLYASGFIKLDKKQSLSGAIRYFNLGEIAEIDESGQATGQMITPNEFAIDVGYSRLFSDKISGGLAFRYIRSDIASGSSSLNTGINEAAYEPGNSFAADLFTYYQNDIRLGNYDGQLGLGANISNIGAKMSYSEDKDKLFIPTNLRLGARLTMDIDDYNSISAMLDINKLLVPTPPIREGDTIVDGMDDNVGTFPGMIQSFYDAPGGFTEEWHEIMWSVGAEYLYREQFALRAGYFHEHETKGNRKYFSAGVGLMLNVFSIDFSYLIPTSGGQSNPLANTIRFTLGFTFE